MYKGRKHFGPLDLAPFRAKRFCEEMTKMHMLDRLLKEITEMEKVIKKAKPESIDVMMAEILKQQLDNQLIDFLGLQKRGHRTNDKISPEKI
jgi:hypothetical protein